MIKYCYMHRHVFSKLWQPGCYIHCTAIFTSHCGCVGNSAMERQRLSFYSRKNTVTKAHMTQSIQQHYNTVYTRNLHSWPASGRLLSYWSWDFLQTECNQTHASHHHYHHHHHHTLFHRSSITNTHVVHQFSILNVRHLAGHFAAGTSSSHILIFQN